MRILIVIALVGVLAAGVLFSSAFVIDETEQAVVTQFGEPVGDSITEAGLYWKKPFIQRVRRFEKRALSFDGSPEQVPTRDKKYIFVDTFARWRIVDPLEYHRAVRDEQSAQARLDGIIDAATRDAISSHLLIEAVRNSNRRLTPPEEALDEAAGDVAASVPVVESDVDAGAAAELPSASVPEVFSDDSSAGQGEITLGRDGLAKAILEAARGKVEQFGIELMDVRIKRINYVEEVQTQIYRRMISEREQIAQKHRSEGNQFRLGFLGKIGREKDRLLSEAYATAEATKAAGDGEAAAIYAEAYNPDPEFYRFYRTLELYRQQLGNNTTLVIGADSDLFGYLKDAGLRMPE